MSFARARDFGGSATRDRAWTALLAAAVAAVVAVVTVTHDESLVRQPRGRTRWAAPGTRPLSDAAASALVVHQDETRPGNVPYNDFVPSDAELRAFHAARTRDGQLADQLMPERRRVTGRPGLRNPSTDDLIQWVAWKWGIPTDLIRAQMMKESTWHQTDAGDRATVARRWYSIYPLQARIAGTRDVFESMGISQVKWRPDESVDPGSEPLRWKSTAFALDLYAATVRYFYDGRCMWCGPGYRAGQRWRSVGAWYEPHPWGNPGQLEYVVAVQRELSNHDW